MLSSARREQNDTLALTYGLSAEIYIEHYSRHKFLYTFVEVHNA